MPDEIAGSHGDPAHSVGGQVLTAQAGTRSSLRTGAPLGTHMRVISCGRHCPYIALLISGPRCRRHSRGAGRVGSESPCSLLTDS